MKQTLLHRLLHTARSGCRASLWLCLAWLAVPASAQVGEHRSELAFGVSGGYALSSVGFTPKVPQTQLGGVSLGATIRYTSEKYFSSICAIVGEVNLVQAGWKEDILDINDAPVMNPDSHAAEAYSRHLTYLQVPVMARLGWGRERKGLQAFFQIGPQVGYLVKEDSKATFGLEAPNLDDRTSKVVEQYHMPVENKFDYGIAGGAGLEFSNPHLGHVMLEGRYYYGLGNLYGNSKRDFFAKSNMGTIVVKMTYLFDLFKTDTPPRK